ncbi:MAG: 1-deoxy-D-xylulose-5-phosphate reductoisomerase [bacterium]
MVEIQRKSIAIIGSTGSIGRQTLEVVMQHPDYFRVEVLTAFRNYQLLISQSISSQPNAVVIEDEQFYDPVREALDPHDIKVYTGAESVRQVMSMENIDQVVMANMGFAGLLPTLAAIENKKNLALANKESLVVAGELIRQAALEHQVQIIPVDSEHSGIFQCLIGEGDNRVDKIVITGSGGPFRGWSAEKLRQVTPAMALNHPVWNMGPKISIDSATLMNKGLELIEAYWLFGLRPPALEVIIHPESVVHSLVYFSDGSVKTQMSQADMKLPIRYALSYPSRMDIQAEKIDLTKLAQLQFEAPDIKNFRNLALAFYALENGGNLPCILNASNEIAVQAFLSEKLSFLQIPQVIETCLEQVSFIRHPSLEDYLETDAETRKKAIEIIDHYG